MPWRRAAPANKDFAGDDAQVASASEVDILTSLSKRRSELDAREAQIQIQANILAATEARVDAKIAQLKGLQSQISALLGQRDAAQEKQFASLVKTYSAMKPKDAARIFDSLNDEVLVPVAEEMKSDVLAPVLAAMNPEQAQKLTVKLANKLTLPDTAGAAPPVPARHPPPASRPRPAASADPRRRPAAAAKAAAPPRQASRPQRPKLAAERVAIHGLPRVNTAPHNGVSEGAQRLGDVFAHSWLGRRWRLSPVRPRAPPTRSRQRPRTALAG